MQTYEFNDFYNDGFGWNCKHCERELENQSAASATQTSRLMREGEAESKQLKLSNLALARWADDAHRTLMCSRCGVTELIDKS